jgi:hypothetical protein
MPAKKPKNQSEPELEPVAGLTKEEALASIVDGDEVHTFRNTVSGDVSLLIGADIRREAILSKIERFPCFLAGPGATAMGHGLCIRDIEDSPLFVQTAPITGETEEDDDGAQE